MSLLIAGSLFALVDAIIEAPDRGWTTPVTLAEGLGGLAALALFVWWELRIRNPLIDLRIFRSRAFSAAAGSVTVIFFALFGGLFVLTQYLQLVHGYSPLSAGIRALPFALATAAAAPLSPLLAKRFGTHLVIPGGMVLMGIGLLYFSTAGVHTSYPALAAAVAIMGAGMGLVMAPASNTIMTTVPANQAGAGSAINDTIREVGGALGVAIVGSLAAAVYRSHLTTVLDAAHVPAAVTRVATGSVAAANTVGARLGGASGAHLVSAAHSAYVTAMADGMRVAAAVAIVSAVASYLALRRPAAPAAATLARSPELAASPTPPPARARRRRRLVLPKRPKHFVHLKNPHNPNDPYNHDSPSNHDRLD